MPDSKKRKPSVAERIEKLMHVAIDTIKSSMLNGTPATKLSAAAKLVDLSKYGKHDEAKVTEVHFDLNKIVKAVEGAGKLVDAEEISVTEPRATE